MHHIVVLLLMVAGAVSAYNEQLIPIHVLVIGLFATTYVLSLYFLLRE